ncbi:MAG TPA: DUF5714 domain-containing protein [Methanocorpusculum sp.]|nr:DUF5714 domain-containing protein [Methanocorpusculum sp.]
MPTTSSNENPACLICGAPLEYQDIAEEMTCSICGKNFLSNAKCTEGHFVCDECHAKPSFAVIRYICLNTKSKDPIHIANKIMRSNAVHMHGPEHHVIPGSALLAAYKNAGGEVDLPIALTMMEHRGAAIPGGFCGLAGACGAAISTGIFLSIILKTNPLSTESWGLGNQLTGKSLIEIGSLGGPRCCKRDSYIAIKNAVEFVREHLGIEMELPKNIVCGFHEENNECLLESCPYHPETVKNRTAR